MQNKKNRISFSKDDSGHLYELSLEHFQKGCFVCDKLKKRLQDFIGEGNVRRIKNVVSKNTYCSVIQKPRKNTSSKR